MTRLPLDDVEAALGELDRAIGDRGMKSVAIGSDVDSVPLNDSKFEPLWAHIDALRLTVFEHPRFPKDVSDMRKFDMPLRVGMVFQTTLIAARLIYSGIFEAPRISHTSWPIPAGPAGPAGDAGTSGQRRPAISSYPHARRAALLKDPRRRLSEITTNVRFADTIFLNQTPGIAAGFALCAILRFARHEPRSWQMRHIAPDTLDGAGSRPSWWHGAAMAAGSPAPLHAGYLN